MKNLIYFFVTLFVLSCVNETEKVSTNLTKNSDSKAITFIIDLAVNADSNEDLTLFSQEITNNVLKTEDFCLEYGYYVSEDGISCLLYTSDAADE